MKPSIRETWQVGRWGSGMGWSYGQQRHQVPPDPALLPLMSSVTALQLMGWCGRGLQLSLSNF